MQIAAMAAVCVYVGTLLATIPGGSTVASAFGILASGAIAVLAVVSIWNSRKLLRANKKAAQRLYEAGANAAAQTLKRVVDNTLNGVGGTVIGPPVGFLAGDDPSDEAEQRMKSCPPDERACEYVPGLLVQVDVCIAHDGRRASLKLDADAMPIGEALNHLRMAGIGLSVAREADDDDG
jgi:hypothetical protein